jgi:hypothetical protein
MGLYILKYAIFALICLIVFVRIDTLTQELYAQRRRISRCVPINVLRDITQTGNPTPYPNMQ